ncbi:MAG: phosphopentomutase, partial [Blautia massiliensis (ex Durand et al. 2017)]
MAKRVFLIVLDSFGIGAEPDAAQFGDAGTNTLTAIAQHPNFKGEHLAELGLFNLDGVTCGTPVAQPAGSFARLREASAGKDTTIGHWEIAGLLSAEPLPTFPDGFPQDLLDAFTAKTGYKVLCNKPYSGTEVIRDYGEEHARTGALIVYTSADSVFQIAANEAIVPVPKLYEICEQARELLTGKYGVGRVIARPFVGDCA